MVMQPRMPQEGVESQEDLRNIKANLRVLEERTTVLQKKTELIENNLLKNARELRSEIRVIHSEITELSHELAELTNKMKQLINELNGYARKEDTELLKKYVEYWEPMNFITRKEAENIIREMMQKEKK